MHDARGKELKVGDTVLIPAMVLSVAAGEYCTLNVETLGVMPGNGTKNQISALNTKQVYRANKEDGFEDGAAAPVPETEERDGKVYLV